MAEIIKGVYNRRHPERTDYYRIIETGFDEFERKYPDMFEENYGYLRKEVTKVIYSFLDCGIPENGIARVRCKKCGNDYFVSFSCRQRVVCPYFADMLLTWNHNSGFNVHAGGYINGEDSPSIEKVAKYISRAPISVDRVEYNPDDNTVVVYEKQDRSNMCESKHIASWNSWRIWQAISHRHMNLWFTITAFIRVRIEARRKGKIMKIKN